MAVGEGSVEFRVLGPVGASAGGAQVDFGHAKQQCVLAVLLLDANRVVHVEQLIDRVWSEEPPASVRSVLYGYIARLRSALRTVASVNSDVRLVRRSGGYVLEVAPELVDVHRFHDLLGEARAAGADHSRVASLIRKALELWRGDPLGGLSGDWAEALRQRLHSEYITATLDRNDAELWLGHHAELLPELRELAAEHPLDERVVGQLMTALFRSGRQAEALECYDRTRKRLVSELGVDPGAELQAVHRQIVRGELPPATPPPPVAHDDAREHGGPRLVPAELPPAVPGFRGRAAEIGRLDALAARTGPGQDLRTVVISALDGVAGVGKTALAVHWAHRMRASFPDGQLHVNLRGFDPDQEPLRPRDALGQLLRSLGLTPQEIPAEEDEQARRYRSLLAGRRVLVVLDNAASAQQVRPLLPGDPSCLVLVTSRKRLEGLVAHEGAQPLTLDTLAPADALALLVAVVGEQRVCAEPDAAAELTRRCGYLPLALRVAAARLACEPGLRIADLAARLAEGSRLAVLELEDDERSAVRAAFELSYRALPTPARKLFRRLGLIPGPDFGPGAAAAVSQVCDQDARGLLDALVTAHLIEPDGTGRYRLHDLLREYAHERARQEDGADQRAQAVERLFGWYLSAADAAGCILYPQIPRLPREAAPGRSVSLADAAEAIDWLEAERANLLAAIDHAARHGPRPVSWYLADTLLGYFWLCLPRNTWQVVAQTALEAAVECGDLMGEAAMCYSMGYALWEVGDLGQAARRHRRALELHQRLDWPPGEAAALSGLGFVEWDGARLQEALGHFTGALRIVREAGQSDAEALALIGVGLVCRDLGRLEEATGHLESALRIRRQAHVRYEANNLDKLGLVYWECGRLHDAQAVFAEALMISEEGDYRKCDAMTLVVIGRIHHDLGRFPEALDLGRRALGLAEDTGNLRIQADALNTIGNAHRRLGHLAEAVEAHRQALLAARSAANRRAEADSLLALSTAHRDQGRYDTALDLARETAAVARDRGFRVVEGQALTALADAHLGLGEHRTAVDLARESLAVQRETGHRLGEARALVALARALRATGDTAEAGTVHGQALAIAACTGAHEDLS
jgi:DNA-binding SARP family transcriptional activator